MTKNNTFFQQDSEDMEQFAIRFSTALSTNTFKNRLDAHWQHRDVRFYYKAEIGGYGLNFNLEI